MRTYVIEIATDKFVHPIKKWLYTRRLFVTCVTISSLLCMRVLLLHLLPFCSTLLTFGPRRVPLFAQSLSSKFEHLSRIGSLTIVGPCLCDLHDTVQQDSNFIPIPVGVSLSRHSSTLGIACPGGLDLCFKLACMILSGRLF